MFRFDNFLVNHPKFSNTVRDVWRHQIHGNIMYGVVCKLKALKGPFRALRRVQGDVSDNVRGAKEYLEKSQSLFDEFKDDLLLQLVQCCRITYCKAVQVEAAMLDREQNKWVQDGDQCSKVFSVRLILAGRGKGSSNSVLRRNHSNRTGPGKSTIILSKSVRRDRQGIIDLMGFQEGSLPIKYLGVPLTSSRLTTTDCQPLLDKFAQRLAGWNHLTLSFAGRTQVIKSVLSSLHILGFGLHAPKVNHPECGTKDEGVSVERIFGFGLRQAGQPISLGSMVNRYKLRSQTIWEPLPNSASWCWKKASQNQQTYATGTCFSVGDGCTFRLWTDPWHPRGLLLSWFPRGPVITGLPADSLLCTVMHQGQWCWPPSRRVEVQGIVAELPPIGPQPSDVITWKSVATGGMDQDIIWASRRWRGKHLINAASRALLASIVYYIWRERNNRVFSHRIPS
ncbi:UNVERIFIED_CONTAM: hypothetical protein Sradi_3921400 [Sesamum radiatum]|uniref:Uncharacterized protein n=1 Tax=Sesamum radiatum TaxID=300843 RepID=A0AAW2PHY0_SESRA